MSCETAEMSCKGNGLVGEGHGNRLAGSELDLTCAELHFINGEKRLGYLIELKVSTKLG